MYPNNAARNSFHCPLRDTHEIQMKTQKATISHLYFHTRRFQKTSDDFNCG